MKNFPCTDLVEIEAPTLEYFPRLEVEDEGLTLDIPMDGQTPAHCKTIFIATRPRWGSSASPYLEISCEDERRELVQGSTGHARYVLAREVRHRSS